MTINWSQIEGTALSDGLQLMKEIQAFGYEAYIVGGAVRDIVMGSTQIHDVDIATNMPMEEIKKNFKAYEYGGGERHGTLLVNRNGEIFELTQFRTEGTYTDGRRPDNVDFVKSFEEDSKRRDFTINAMGVDVDGVVIDYHGGCEDISNKLLRTVGDASERFNEDALRMVRAVRIAAKLGFKIDSTVIDAIKKYKQLLSSVSKERIRDELQKLADVGPRAFAYGIELVAFTDLLDYIIEGPRCCDVSQSVERISKLQSGYFELYLAILFDVYIPSTVKLCEQLKLTNDQIMSIDFAINTMVKLNQLMEMSRVEAYKIVSHKYFNLTKDLYLAYHNDSDILIDIEFISKFKVAYAMQKTISALMLKCELFPPGPEFGKTLSSILNIVFHYFETNEELPTEEIICMWLAYERKL